MSTIAIQGAGNVGCALAERLMKAGAAVMFGARDPAAVTATLAGRLPDITVTTPADAAADADIIMLAVPAAAAIAATRDAGNLSGKILVDCTNPVKWEGGPVWAPPAEGSVAQALAKAFPGVRVLKGFNHFGAEIHANPKLQNGGADAFFAGDDADAKRTVIELASRMGFQASDAGPLRNAALLENLAVLWIHLATATGGTRGFAFRRETQQ